MTEEEEKFNLTNIQVVDKDLELHGMTIDIQNLIKAEIKKVGHTMKLVAFMDVLDAEAD
jgi:hypothetical protein